MPGYKVYNQAVEIDFVPVIPGFFEISPWDAHQNINSYGRDPHLIKVTLFREIIFCQAGEWGPEKFERLIDCRSIVRICTDPQI